MAGAGCSNTTPIAQPEVRTSAETRAPARTQKKAPSKGPADRECIGLTTADGFGLYRTWRPVVGSRGASDHPRWVDKFSEEAKDLADDTRLDDSCGELGMMTSQLSLEAAILMAEVFTSSAGEATTREYKAVADAGNTLMRELGVDEEFRTR